MDRRDISASSPVRKQGPGTLEHGCNESHFSRVSGWRRGCYLSMEVRLSVGVCAGRSLNRLRQPRRALDQNSLEFGPERSNPLVRYKMAAERAMSGVRVTVEPDVLREKVPEGLEERPVPIWSRQECGEHRLEAAVLVTGQAVDPGIDVDRPNLG